MIHDGTQTVATAGVRVALASTRTPAAWVIIQAKVANGGSVFVGGRTVSSSTGIELRNGDSIHFGPMDNNESYDLANLFIDASANNQAVAFVFGRRV